MLPIDFHKVSLVAVDPGLRGCGMAVFTGGLLSHASYVVNPDKRERGPNAHMQMAEEVASAASKIVPSSGVHILLEFPQVYGSGFGGKPIDQNDLLDIAGVSAATMSVLANWLPVDTSNCRWVLPAAWKGNIKKEIMTERILATLAQSERGVIVSHARGAKDHNTVDAIGLGLWQLGRLNRKSYN